MKIGILTLPLHTNYGGILQGYAFIDYSRDSRFLSDSYYASALFLNDLGAKYFTKQLLTDLNLI